MNWRRLNECSLKTKVLLPLVVGLSLVGNFELRILAGALIVILVVAELFERLDAEDNYHRVAEDLERYTHELETAKQMQEENARQLTQLVSELEQANDKTLQAAKAKSEFLANMSHEIRTPMNGVIGMLQLIQNTQLTEDQKDYVNTATHSAESLLEIINDILDFSKIEAGKLKIESIPFDLQALIHEVVTLFSVNARQRGLELSAHFLPNRPYRVIGDPGRLRQVLTNLVGNALKFTPHGQIRIHSKCEVVNEARALYVVSVEDSGIGMSAEQLAGIFDRFQQVDTSTTRQYGGTGLGLAICRQLMELMGGSIDVRSTTGKGSTFTFQIVLPLDSNTPVPVPVPKRPEPTLAEPVVQRRTRVLLVEDNVINQKVAFHMLGHMGYEVDMANHGQAALDALARFPYAVILMDCQMPVMDGYEAARQIRLREEGARWKVPIIAMTAHAMEGDRQKCLSAGMNDYLSKPFKTLELEALMHRWTQPFDVSEQEHIRQVFKEKFGELDQLYVDFERDIREQLVLIDHALSQKDAAGVESAAHHVKGASGSLGALRMYEMASHLEKAGRAKQLDNVSMFLEALQEGYSAACHALAERRRSQVVTRHADNPTQEAANENPHR